MDLSLELVGATALRDTLRTLKVHGVACFTGVLSNSWVVEDFYPIDDIPTGIRLAAYFRRGDGPAGRGVAGTTSTRPPRNHGLIPPDRVFALERIGAAHEYMEQDRATGKIVVTPHCMASG